MAYVCPEHGIAVDRQSRPGACSCGLSHYDADYHAPVAIGFGERPANDLMVFEASMDDAFDHLSEEIVELLRSHLSQQAKRGALGSNEPFSGHAQQKLAALLEGLIAKSELAGAATVRTRQLQRLQANDIVKANTFTEQPAWTILTAYEWFKSLFPTDSLNKSLFEMNITGRAFMLAVTTEQIILRKVHASILYALEHGASRWEGAAGIDKILKDAGIVARRGYADLVFRTNALEAYRTGGWGEYQKPVYKDFFPVWRYVGIDDGRQRKGPLPRPDHNRWFRKYFPRNVSFFDVRGHGPENVANCRCGFTPIYDGEWKRLQFGGARLFEGNF